MLSIRRIALTAAATAALAAPAAQAAQAAPVERPPSHDGFEWSDAALGGGAGAALGFVLLVGGGALTALSVEHAASGQTRLRPPA